MSILSYPREIRLPLPDEEAIVAYLDAIRGEAIDDLLAARARRTASEQA